MLDPVLQTRMSAIEETKREISVPKAAAGVAPLSFVTRTLNLLSSVRFGVTLLVLLVVACMIGMLIMQQNVEGFDKYYAQLTPSQKLLYGPHARAHRSALQKQIPVYRRSSGVVACETKLNRIQRRDVVLVAGADALDGEVAAIPLRVGAARPRAHSSRHGG